MMVDIIPQGRYNPAQWPTDVRHQFSRPKTLEEQLDDAIEIISKALDLRLFGEDHHLGGTRSQKAWDDRAQDFLMSHTPVFALTARKNNMGHNGTPSTKGIVMSDKTQNENPVVEETAAPVEEAPKKTPFYKNKKVVITAAATAAGVVAIVLLKKKSSDSEPSDEQQIFLTPVSAELKDDQPSS